MRQNAVVTSRNFYLRPLLKDDIANGWLEWMRDSETTRYLSYSESVNPESLERYLQASQPPSHYMFAICLTSDDQYIGNAKIGSINWVHKNATYGRLIGVRPEAGKGIGTDVLKALAGFAFFRLNLHRIYTSVVDANVASIKSNEKAGARKEGVLRDHFLSGTTYIDCTSFSIIRTDVCRANWEKHFELLDTGRTDYGDT